MGRARGALLGLACGDALGTTNEFKRIDAPPFPALATGPLTDIVGGGPFNLVRGQVTDDTQMAVCLADSLVACDGFNADDAARRYLEWMKYAFDVGAQTSAALHAIQEGIPAQEAGRKVWLARQRSAAGNGSLMRTAPIGVLLESAEQRRRASLEDSAITHFDPRCQIACAAFNAAIAVGVRQGEMLDMWSAASDEIDAAANSLLLQYGDERDAIESARSALASDLEAARSADPRLYGPELHLLDQQGFVRVAFRLAFWELRHTGALEEALIDVVNRGGDADTNAAITGALIGARFGEDGISGQWYEAVLGALQTSPSEPSLGPLASEYHPRRFMEITATRSTATKDA